MNGIFTGELKVVGTRIIGHFTLGQDDYWAMVAEMDERIEDWEKIAEMMVWGSKE